RSPSGSSRAFGDGLCWHPTPAELSRELPMNMIDRRRFLQATTAGLVVPAVVLAAEPALEKATDLSLAVFRFDVTPPVGHSLCGGWIKPVAAVDDALEA